ncbi:MAG: phosphatase PAP2 family protein [Solirubrobacteraceae bacterium]|nr:phosphatase PAP2 family protein [Solirubrobacteraceae bacterium]
MPPRARELQARLFPQGYVDLARQILLFAAAYYAYRYTRGWVNGPESAATAFENARNLIGVERALNVFVEPGLQTLLAGERWIFDAASWVYINAQTTVTLGCLVWIYLLRNKSFYFVRNMFLTAFFLALVGYVLYPTAPPRFFPEWGFHDTVEEFTGIPQDSVTIDNLFNPYAAVPSMHVGFSLMIGWPLARLCKRRPVKVFWAIYPLIVTFVIVVTANHFLADAFLGALTAGAGALVAVGLSKLRPVWRFDGHPETDLAPVLEEELEHVAESRASTPA